jgi:hypothetical protein
MQLCSGVLKIRSARVCAAHQRVRVPKRILERKDELGQHEVWSTPRVNLAVSFSQVCPPGIARCCTRVVENGKEK